MKIQHLAAACAAAFLTGGLSAQSVTPAPTDDQAVVLSPFNVSTSKDVGFVGANGLAGGRLATALKDTPVAYSVITHEFIDAFNIADLGQALQWTVGANFNPSDGADQGFAFAATRSYTIRGIQPAEYDYPSRNFFPYNSSSDSFDIERYDFARGPNAVLFGAGQFGGTPNMVTKEALFGKKLRELQLSYGSWNRLRSVVDVNQPLNDKVAVRVAGVAQRGDTWRDAERKELTGAYAAVKIQVTPAFSIRANGEYVDEKKWTALTSIREHMSAWDGKTVFNGTPSMTAAQQAVAGVSQYSSNGMYVYDPAAFGTSNVINFASGYKTKGAAYNSNVANTNYINGRPILTPGVSWDGYDMIYSDLTPIDRFATDFAGSPYFALPKQSFTTLYHGGRPTYGQSQHDSELLLDYKLGDFFFEVAGDVNHTDQEGNNAVNRGMAEVYLDVNQTLPTGAPNPNYLRPYSEFWTYLNRRSHGVETGRVQAVYSHDFSFGKLQWSGIAGAYQNRRRYRALEYLLPLTSVGPDARAWVQASGNTALYTRQYYGQYDNYYNTNLGTVTVVDPKTGTTSQVTPHFYYDATRQDNNSDATARYKYWQTAANLDLFHNKFVVIGAFRRDLATYHVKGLEPVKDLAPGWDGLTYIARPDAPADWGSLTYVPKNASGVPIGAAQPADSRPTASVNGVTAAAPQYANDRFRDDYNSPTVHAAVNTYSVGATYNITKSIGLYGNASTTFKFNDPNPRLTGQLLPPTAAHGTDYGIKATLPDGKLAITLGGFHSYQKNSKASVPIVTDYNNIWATPAVGDLSASGRNIEGVGSIPTIVNDISTYQSSGYEAEITANITPSWRLILNGAYTKAYVSDQFQDSRAYVNENDALARKVLADAGVLIDANNNATINPALNDPTKINVSAVTKGASAWNDLFTNVLPNMATGRQKYLGGMEQTANIATDYKFREGMLRGLLVGGGINYRGRMALGYRGADTIVNPANPTTAIHDPSVSAYTTVWSTPYYLGAAHAGYEWRLKSGHTVKLDLNINNLFNRRAPIFSQDPGGAAALGTTVLRPRNGDISQPAVVTVPGSHYYIDPINFTLRATLEF